MITERDKKIIKYLKEHGATDLQTLHELFFTGYSNQWCNRRLKTLVDNSVISRKKLFETSKYVYYVEV